jgi:hypothetical protein
MLVKSALLMCFLALAETEQWDMGAALIVSAEHMRGDTRDRLLMHGRLAQLRVNSTQ